MSMIQENNKEFIDELSKFLGIDQERISLGKTYFDNSLNVCQNINVDGEKVAIMSPEDEQESFVMTGTDELYKTLIMETAKINIKKRN